MKKVSFGVIIVFCFCSLSACGNSSGSTTNLSTVYLTASPASDRLEVDVLVGNSCTTGGGAFTTQTIPITVTSTAYANVTKPSPVTISGITVTYRKYDASSPAPALSAQYDTGKVVFPGSSTFDVKVAPDKLNLDLVQTYNMNLCSADYWEYYATISFKGVEDFTGKPVSFNTEVKVAFADRNNL